MTTFGKRSTTRRKIGAIPAPVITLVSVLMSPTPNFTNGASQSGTFSNAQGVITITGAPTGFTYNSAARTWSFDGTGGAGSGTFAITDTLAGAVGNPKLTNIGWTIAAAAAVAPTNSVAPAVSGTAQDGQTLSVTNGTWANSPTGFAYQWFTNTTSSTTGGTAISGATSSTLALATAQVGLFVYCRVTASNTGGSTPALSNITAAVIAAGSGAARTASVVTRTSANTIPPSPTFTFTRPVDWVNGDSVVSQISSDETFATGVAEVTLPLSAGTTSYDLINPDATSGPKYIRIAAYNGTSPTVLVWSNTIGAGDTAAPTITSSAARSVPQSTAGSLTFTASKGGYLQIVGGVDQGVFSTSGPNLQVEAQYTPRDYLVQVQWVSYAGVPSTTMNCTITVADVTAPILSSPVAPSGISGTTGVAGVSVDEISTIFIVGVPANVAPSGAQVEAGQDNTGTAAYPQTPVVVSATGAQTITINNGIPSTRTYFFAMAKDSSNNRSAVLYLGFGDFGAAVATSGWATTSGYALTNGGKTANPDNSSGGNPDILGTGVVSSGVKTIIMTCDFTAGLACDPGLKDTGSGVSMIWKADGSAAFPYVWNGTNPRHAALKMVCDFTARTVAAYIDGTLKGTIAMPTGFNNVRAVGNMQYGTTPYITLDTTNWV